MLKYYLCRSLIEFSRLLSASPKKLFTDVEVIPTLLNVLSNAFGVPRLDIKSFAISLFAVIEEQPIAFIIALILLLNAHGGRAPSPSFCEVAELLKILEFKLLSPSADKVDGSNSLDELFTPSLLKSDWLKKLLSPENILIDEKLL